MTRRFSRDLALRALFAFIALSPVLPGLFERVPGLRALGGLLDAWFQFQCERDPVRTFDGFAVCARCFGIYAGFGLGGVLGVPRPKLPMLRAWIAGSALLLVVDVLSEALGFRPASAALRLGTGFLLSYPVGLAVTAAFRAPS